MVNYFEKRPANIVFWGSFVAMLMLALWLCYMAYLSPWKGAMVAPSVTNMVTRSCVSLPWCAYIDIEKVQYSMDNGFVLYVSPTAKSAGAESEAMMAADLKTTFAAEVAQHTMLERHFIDSIEIHKLSFVTAKATDTSKKEYRKEKKHGK